MQRNVLRAWLLVLAVLLLGALPAAAQTSEDDGVLLSNENGNVLVGLGNDVTLAAGEEADFIFVADANALIEGSVNGIVAIDSEVVITGASAEVGGIFSAGGTLDISTGATVDNVAYTETVVSIDATAVVDPDNVNDIQDEFVSALAWIVAALAILAFFIVIGWILAVLLSALLVVAFGTSQLRRAAFNIGNDVLKTLVAGLLMLIVPWIIIGLLAITIVGLPLAIGLAIMWMFVAFLGYLTVGLWIGERILKRARTATRPYGAAFLGTLILILLGFIPGVGFLVGSLAIWFGLGAVSLAGWRVLRGGGVPPVPPGYGQPYGQPSQVPPPPYAPPPYAPPPPPQGQWPPQGGPPTSWPQG